MTRTQKAIADVIKRNASGQFLPIDLSLAGVNAWREKNGLPPLTQTGLTGRTE